jgi:MFS family permease
MPQMPETPDSTGETRSDDVAAAIERACNEETMTREADLEAPTSEATRFGRTVESFRYRDFSLFWSGALVSNVGTWMQNTALGLVVVYGLNQGAFVLGIINFLSGIPVLFLALPGGALADRVDRRRLIIVFQWIQLVQAAALGYLAMNGTVTAITGPAAAQHAMQALFWLGGLGMIAGICSALTFPAWQALLPAMVPRKVLLNAIALNSAQFQSSRLLGPLAAAAIIGLLNPAGIAALFGPTMAWIFYINAISFLFVIAALWAIKPGRFEGGGQHAEASRSVRGDAGHGGAAELAREDSWKMLLGGIDYARTHRHVAILLISTALMTIFGMPYVMLLPVIVKDVLHMGEIQVTILMSANGLGAVVGALGVASFSPKAKRERLMPMFLLAFAVMLALFGLSHWYYVSIVISAFAGAGMMAAISLTNTSIQASVPDYLRGRVMALFIMCFMGIMPVSAILFGSLGQVIGPSNAVFGGAVILFVWALVLVFVPKLLAPEPVEACVESRSLG